MGLRPSLSYPHPRRIEAVINSLLGFSNGGIESVFLCGVTMHAEVEVPGRRTVLMGLDDVRPWGSRGRGYVDVSHSGFDFFLVSTGSGSSIFTTLGSPSIAQIQHLSFYLPNLAKRDSDAASLLQC